MRGTSRFAIFASLLFVSCMDHSDSAPTDPSRSSSDPSSAVMPSSAVIQPVVVRVLDVGQGDANLIVNGNSKVLIDGGPDLARFRVLIDSLGLNNTTIDAVIVSHGHSDHASGLRALFERNRNIRIRYFFDNGDQTTFNSVQQLRDSAVARANRGELVYRDTDDPCGDGSTICTLLLDGGAKLHVMRPDPNGSNVDNRTAPVKLVGPDSASFTMWFAGDARHEAIDWFIDHARYDLAPGMKVDVLKGQEHGNCRAIPHRFLGIADPGWLTFSLAANNPTGLIHNETKALLANHGRSWYRTDQNGSITFVSSGVPGGGFTVSATRGGTNLNGPSDSPSGSQRCVWPSPPAAPSQLAAVPVSSSEIHLSWTDNSGNEDGFRIERRSGGGSFAEIASVGANVATYGDTGLAASTTYEYRVRAFNGGGTSPYSNTASATTPSAPPQPPAAPTALTAVATSASQIALSWTDNSGNEDGFRIERRSGGGSFAEIATVGANVTTYGDTGLAASTAYEYRVRAFNGGGTSPYSNTASATTPSAPPSITLSTAGYKDKGLHKADLSWSGTSAQRVDIFRDGTLIATVSNNGTFTDHIDNRGSQTYTHQICEEGRSTCSNITTTGI
jgi:beta-lactamase superfamily II metal-dependent hydrolase